MIEIRKPYLVQPEPEEPKVEQVPGTSMITVTAPLAIKESTEPTYTMDEEGIIKGKGIAIHPSYYERTGLHPYVQKRIAMDLLTEYERSKIPSSVQRRPYGNIEEYQIDLVRTIASPITSQEEKTRARLELMRIGRLKEKGYEFPMVYDVETRIPGITAAKPYYRPEAIREAELREEERYLIYRTEETQRIARNWWAAVPLLVAGAYTKEDPMFLTSVGAFLLTGGGIPERTYAAYDTHLKAHYALQKAKMEEGFWGVTKKIFEPGSPLFTTGTTLAISTTFGLGFGALARIAPTIAKITQIGTGGYFIGRAGGEITTIATKGKTIKWGGPLGLVPQGITQMQPMKPEQRFSSLAMFGVSLPFAVTGYMGGRELGYSLMAKIYTPKYFTQTYVYPRLQKTAEDQYGIAFKGTIDYQLTRIRTIFGRQIPFGRETYTTTLPIKGILGKKPMVYISKTGKVAVWRTGEVMGELGGGILYKKFLGITLSQKYPGGDILKVFPSREVKVKIGKELTIGIQPYEYSNKLAKMYIEKPIITLAITPKMLSTEIFKPMVESKYYPSIVTKEGITTKGLTQIWELPETKRIMEKPHLEEIQVKRYLSGRPIAELPGIEKQVGLAYGFTIKGPERPPEIWLTTLDSRLPKDFYVRTSKEAKIAIIGHELTHRLFTRATTPFERAKEEFMVQVISRTLDQPYHKGLKLFDLSHKTLVTREKEIFPIVSKAAKNYLETGKLGLKEQRGMEQYELSPFRQITKTVSTDAIITGKAYGIAAYLKGIKITPETKEISYFKSKPTIPIDEVLQQLEPTLGIKQLLIVKETKYKIIPPAIELSLLWKPTTLGYLGGKLPEFFTPSKTEQKYITEKVPRDLSNIFQIQIEPSINLQKIFLNLMEGTDYENIQKQSQLQLQSLRQKTELQYTQITVVPITITPVIPIPKTPILPTDEVIKKAMPGLDPNQAFNVFVKPRTYVSGKRIRPDSYEIKLNKKPLNYKDAMNLGSHTIDQNEKASFVVVPVEGRPTKLRKKIPSFFSHSYEFVQNKKGQIVEIPSSRIDSPGEIEAITMRGINARKNKSSREERTMNSINKKVERTIKSMVRKAGGIF